MTDDDKIQELIARLGQADSDKDSDGFAALFTENGAYRGKRGESRGREALRTNLAERTRLNPPDRRTMHLFGVGIVRVDGDKATGVWPYVAYGRIGNSPWEIMSVGRFHTELVREGDGWLFTDVENRSIGAAGGPATIRHSPSV